MANRKNVPAGVRFWSIHGVSCPIRYVPIHKANPAMDMASPRTLVGYISERSTNNHGADGNGTAEYIEQEENEQEEAGYSQAFAEKKVSTDQEKGKDHARYAVVNQFLTSHFVDDDKRQDGGQGVN